MTNLEPNPAAGAGRPRGWMPGSTFAAAVVAFALAQAAGAQGPADPRFFGTYCQPRSQDFCKSIPFLPDPCVTLSGARISLDHLEVPAGGTIRGGGTFRLDGKPGSLAVAGSVTGLGRARLAGTIPALGDGNMRQQGTATLSSDGLELRASVQNRTVVLRKDACGNEAPAVTLAVPSGPAFAFGQPVFFDGRVIDEDTSFPLERMVFRSSRQSPMPGFLSAAGQTPGFVAVGLAPGEHRVTLTVTDSGGLTGRASVRVTIIDRPPETPVIFLPGSGATLAAGAPVLLQGQAHDPDTGFLADAFLGWSAQLAPGGPFVPLGAGRETAAVFASPADPVTIRLTATSTAGGGQSSRSRQPAPVTKMRTRAERWRGAAPPRCSANHSSASRSCKPAAVGATIWACAQGPIVSTTSTPRLRKRWYCSRVCGRKVSCQPPISRIGTCTRSSAAPIWA